MPVVVTSTYSPPFLFSNGHLQTVFASFRKVAGVRYEREKMDTADADFLNLDWARTGAKRIAVLCHGLEGSTNRPYILGMIRALHRHGWDALAWNYRGCGGETNNLLRWYHSGETADLQAVLSRVIAQDIYEEIALIGFSLGGNITLKYLGEQAGDIDPRISCAVAFSVPCDLRSGAHKLATFSNRLYMRMFLRTLHAKVIEKMRRMPGEIDDVGFDQLKTFVDFDNRYTAPIHGFQDAEDYFRKSSSRQFLPSIQIPTLLVNAKNDPFLGDACFPYEEAEASPVFYFESPESGGHTAFISFGGDGEYWSETRALSFLEATTKPQRAQRT